VMADRDLEPRNAFVCTEMAAVRGLASKGLGLAVIPRSVAETPGPPIELRPIGPERLTWPIALVWRVTRRQAPAGKAFIAVALKYAKAAEQPGLRAA
jgi:DNA-binding transcriptional LysR family regulator